MIKRLLILFTILFVLSTSLAKAPNSEKKRRVFEYGFSGAINLAKLNGTSADNYLYGVGFSAAFITEIRVFNWFSVAPELKYSLQGTSVKDIDTRFNLHYISLPVMLKFYPAKKLSIDLGVYFGYAISMTTLDALYDKASVNKYDFGFVGGLTYNLDRRFSIFGRYVQGVVTIFPNSGNVYNSVIQAGVAYKF